MSRPSLAADHALFAASARRFHPLSDADIDAALGQCVVRQLARGEYLLRAGEQASAMAFVTAGLVREFFMLPDGTERTKAFVQAGEGTGSLADLLSGEPSNAYIVAEEPTRLLTLRFELYLALIENSSGWSMLYRRFVEAMFVVKATREYELIGLDAAARYERFAQRYPGLETRVQARHVASYLGITPVHLSRLRRRRRVPAAR